MNDDVTLDDVDVDDILDMTLDDLEDLPTFEPYPAGAHRVSLSMELKTVNDKKSVEVELKLIETLELAEPLKGGEKAPVEGAETSILCGLSNKWGRGEFKSIATPIGAALGIASNREIIEQAKNIDCVVITWVQTSKKDGVSRTKIKEVIMD